jgi:hypothetical protein
MSLKTLKINFIEIPRVGFVAPGAMFRRMNLFEALSCARNYGFEILNSREINKVASFVREEEPKEEWVERQVKRYKASEEVVEESYAKLHDSIFEPSTPEYCLIRAYEILKPPSTNKNFELMRNFDIDEKGLITSGKAIEVNWQREEGIIPKNVAKILNAEEDTWVYPRKNSDYLVTLDWEFMPSSYHRKSYLHSYRTPFSRVEFLGYLIKLGKRDLRNLEIQETETLIYDSTSFLPIHENERIRLQQFL